MNPWYTVVETSKNLWGDTMVGYPNQKRSYQKKHVSQSRRGMDFEQAINETNKYYFEHDIAIIYKKPIPIQIVKVDYPHRSAAVIKEAYYKVPSTTDYNGIYRGKYIDFEAKETRNKTNFPLNNIHKHQFEHLFRVMEHGGIAFILIHLHYYDETYLLPARILKHFFNRSKNGRKSITIRELKTNGYLVKESLSPRLDYLSIVDKLIEEGCKEITETKAS